MVSNTSIPRETPLPPSVTPPSPSADEISFPVSTSPRPTPTLAVTLSTPSASTSQLSLIRTYSPTNSLSTNDIYPLSPRRTHLHTPSTSSNVSRLTLESETYVGSGASSYMDTQSLKRAGSFNSQEELLKSKDGRDRSPSIGADSIIPSTETQGHSTITSRPEFPESPSTSQSRTEPPPKDPLPSPTNKESVVAIIKSSYFNALVIFIPIAWAFKFAGMSDTLIFITSFIAIIPLAALLGFGTDELSKRVGQTIGGLVNATLGNIVEVIIAILALAKCELNVVQSSLLGSILSNLLLVLGTCFFCGGIKYSLLPFKAAAASLSGSLLFMSTTSILIPVIFHSAFGVLIPDTSERPDLLKISRGASVILLFIYIGFLFCQLYSHSFLYDDNIADDEVETKQPNNVKLWGQRVIMQKLERKKSSMKRTLTEFTEETAVSEPEDNEENPEINLLCLTILLLVVSALTGVTSEFLVDAIQGFTTEYNISQEFVGLILLPIIGNTAEHYSAILAALNGKVDLAIGISVGSGIQISLFVIPLMVTIGWIINKPMSLLFDPFEALLIFVAASMASQAIGAGRANFLSGWILLCTYLIMALAIWFYPDSVSSSFSFFSC